MRRDTFFQAIRRDFFYGLMVVLPIAITFWVVNSVIDIVSLPFAFLFSYKIHRLISFFVSLSIIFVIGIITRHFVGRSVLSQMEKLVFRIPIISTIYKSSKQIITSFSLNSHKQMEVVLVEFPRKDVWTIAFVSKKEIEGFTHRETGETLLKEKWAVFVPTSPNPATGYLLFVEPSELIPLKMGFEEAMKLTVSIGSVSMSSQHVKK